MIFLLGCKKVPCCGPKSGHPEILSETWPKLPSREVMKPGRTLRQWNSAWVYASRSCRLRAYRRQAGLRYGKLPNVIAMSARDAAVKAEVSFCDTQRQAGRQHVQESKVLDNPYQLRYVQIENKKEQSFRGTNPIDMCTKWCWFQTAMQNCSRLSNESFKGNVRYAYSYILHIQHHQH